MYSNEAIKYYNELGVCIRIIIKLLNDMKYTVMKQLNIVKHIKIENIANIIKRRKYQV